MPHEVIMPALGMAQDSGLIVAWRKASGDKVAPGDVLMEVETDKATMEVEAQAGGFLTGIRASEGETVPVGDIVALIAESPEEVKPASAGETVAEKQPEEVAPASEEAAAGGNEVIMPALGMAQDTGLLVAWRKSPGDAVAANDILLEVETDKSTMEVEAGHDGYVAELRAEAGDSVPVGDVIAIISKDKPKTPSIQSKSQKNSTQGTENNKEKAPSPQKVAEPPAGKAAAPRPAAVSTDGRILASPKAKRLAAERGLDLSRLAAIGHPQPYHIADLDRLAALPAPVADASPGATRDRIEARIPAAAYAEFRAWMNAETGNDVGDLAVLSAFAAAAWRQAAGQADAPVVVSAKSAAPNSEALFRDPDRAGFNEIEVAEDTGDTSLILRDLTGSRISSLEFGASEAPVITVVRDAENIRVTLDIRSGALDADAAITFLDEMAARLESPLRQLL